MTSIPSNYISNAELMAWMAEKTNGLYGEMADAIDLSNDRSKMVEDLQNLKTDIQRAKDTGSGWAEIQERMQAIFDQYGEGPYAAELEELLGPMKTQVDKVVRLSSNLGQIGTAIQESGGGISLRNVMDIVQGNYDKAVPTNESLDRWMDQIDDKTDALGREDQLGMIAINDINSRIGQTTQLASNLISAASKTLDSVVANIRG